MEEKVRTQNWSLEVDSFASVSSYASFFERLADSGMSVTDASDVLCRSAILHRECCLVYKLSCLWEGYFQVKREIQFSRISNLTKTGSLDL